MRIIDKLGGGEPAFSFEFFPPKDAAGTDQLFQTVTALERLGPAYVSVTYGAGGSTRQLTVELVQRIKAELGIEAMAHLTCASASAAELTQVLEQLQGGGVENVLALRGDPPQGQAAFERPEGGFAHASELVTLIKERTELCVAAACYPEGHPESASLAQDLQHLVHKVRCGVDFLVTQLFFEPRLYFELVARARAAGITCPIIPGIMPITNLAQLKRFTALCGASIPAALLAELEACGTHLDAVRELGVAHAISQCRALLDGGAPGIHFYTLNKSLATQRVLSALR